MRVATFCSCLIMVLYLDGCSGRTPRADMVERYPRKPFDVKNPHHAPPLSDGRFITRHFVMPPGGDASTPVEPLSIQRPIKGTGENGARPAFPALTDTEVTYGH
ncbi:hypothetical protein GS501_09685 [Saccharibacter sp. 17.LH.SD]|uniref:hypothetical protein n=1 Tax=Saccharibacter sp. 17.LH.SD TaxID=2689393 RepID=UPI001371AE2D|nr:hypothetical protein [Saccharibacter sp. 17.LH.SD]MXV45301.1 hypothetical protein [Saccharibacter sp. 17.LH.SD]